MKSLIWLVILVFLASAAALGLHHFAGDIYLLLGNTLVRMNINLFIVALIGVVLVLYLIMKIIHGTLRLPAKWRYWRKNKRSFKASQALNLAGAAYFEGRFEKAMIEVNKVLANPQGSRHQALALMIGANSANQLNKTDDYQYFLQEISNLPANQQLSRHLLSAKVALAAGSLATADIALQEASKLMPNLTSVVELKLRLANAQKSPENMLREGAKLHKAALLSDEEWAAVELASYEIMLENVNNINDLKANLKRIPKAWQAGELSTQIAKAHVQLGLYHEAVQLIQKHYPIQKQAAQQSEMAHKNDAMLDLLVRANRYLPTKVQQTNLDAFELQLKQAPQDASLLCALGQMAADLSLWGKAEDYLQAAIAMNNNREAKHILIKVLHEMGDENRAQKLMLSLVQDAGDFAKTSD